MGALITRNTLSHSPDLKDHHISVNWAKLHSWHFDFHKIPENFPEETFLICLLHGCSWLLSHRQKQQKKQFKFNKFRLSILIFFNNITFDNILEQHFLAWISKIYVQKENSKYRRKFEGVHKKPELEFLPEKCNLWNWMGFICNRSPPTSCHPKSEVVHRAPWEVKKVKRQGDTLRPQ